MPVTPTTSCRTTATISSKGLIRYSDAVSTQKTSQITTSSMVNNFGRAIKTNRSSCRWSSWKLMSRRERLSSTWMAICIIFYRKCRSQGNSMTRQSFCWLTMGCIYVLFRLLTRYRMRYGIQCCSCLCLLNTIKTIRPCRIQRLLKVNSNNSMTLY